MKHLYQKIYLTIVVTLLVVVVTSATIWRFGPGRPQENSVFEITRELVAIALPPSSASNVTQAQEVAKLANRLKVDVALYDENLKLITTTSHTLPKPDGKTRGIAHGRGKPSWMFQISDKRWVVARAPKFRHRSAFSMLTFLGGIALLIAICAYPFVRGLTRRLERLQVGVETLGTGDLSTRVHVKGRDEIAQLAASFNDAAAQIESLFDAHHRLLANASHELRTPLARIRMGIELLKKDPGEQRHIELEKDISELDQLIDEILLVSRLEAVTNIEAPERIDLLALAAEESARYDACWLHGEPAFVMGDQRLLRRLIRNLLENATCHGEPPIEVEVMPVNGHIALTVSDHGSGIPISEWENVFKPFHRVPGSQNTPGSGLGLALVRQIAQRHEGTSKIVAKEGGNSSIRIEIPAA